MRLRLVIIAMGALAASAPCQGSRSAISASQLRPLARVARSLASIGRRAEANEVVQVLEQLGQSEPARKRLARTLATAKVNAGKAHRAMPRIIKDLERAALSLERALPRLAPEARVRVARGIVRLHGNVPRAQQVLGRTRHGGRWLSKEGVARAQRWAEIQDAVQRARRLQFEITVAPSTHWALRTAYQRDGITVSWKRVRIHSVFGEARARRLLGNTLRAAALASWLVDGVMEPPRSAAFRAVVLDSKPAYDKCIAHELAAGHVGAKESARRKRLGNFFLPNGVIIDCNYTESGTLSALFCYTCYARSAGTNLDDASNQACLVAGLGNWALQAIYGTGLPAITWTPTASRSGAKQPTESAAGGESTREEMQMLAGAGLMGCRSWLRYLAARREDPPWSRSMLNQLGKIDRENLLKSTMVVEYLLQAGPLRPLLKATKGAVGKDTGTVVAAFGRALGCSLEVFETRWRRWILDADRPLTERLGALSRAGLSRSEEVLLARLHALRKAAFRHHNLAAIPLVGLDRELSRGAELHARYLERYPDQARKWPDAHEERSDREGFTPKGAWSGAHAVIISGVSKPEAALDGWMGTFYHRLPLLEPGLLRVGWGRVGHTAVLDSGSIVRVWSVPWYVAWPYANMKDVPVSFAGPELPNPVPGQDQTPWGYPITLQVMPDQEGGAAPEITMELRLGAPDGVRVECWLSTPNRPTNPDLAPDRAFCLIPKAKLRKGHEYWVTATWLRTGRKVVWSFKT